IAWLMSMGRELPTPEVFMVCSLDQTAWAVESMMTPARGCGPGWASDVADDVGIGVGVLFLRVGQDLDGLVLFVVQALQAQHVHLLVVAFGIDQALDLRDGGLNLAPGRIARNDAASLDGMALAAILRHARSRGALPAHIGVAREIVETQ